MYMVLFRFILHCVYFICLFLISDTFSFVLWKTYTHYLGMGWCHASLYGHTHSRQGWVGTNVQYTVSTCLGPMATTHSTVYSHM